MARRELSPAQLAVVQAVSGWLAETGRPIVVACSGGPDSMALAAAVAHLAGRDPELATRVSACVIDHGLQPGSGHVAAQVVARLHERGLSGRIVGVQVDGESAAGPEAAAREARYTALAAGPAAGRRVLLGHNLDDQAETVLLGLARGSGTRSLAGMPQRFIRNEVEFVRPLLDIRRATIERACHDWALHLWYDPHNLDKRYTRVRVRTSVLPTLEAELGPGVSEALARTAELARDDADLLDRLAGEQLAELGAELPVGLLAELPRALASRVLRGWLIAGGVAEPNHGHLQAVWVLVEDWRGQHGVDLPGGVRIARRSGMLTFG